MTQKLALAGAGAVAHSPAGWLALQAQTPTPAGAGLASLGVAQPSPAPELPPRGNSRLWKTDSTGQQNAENHPLSGAVRQNAEFPYFSKPVIVIKDCEDSKDSFKDPASLTTTITPGDAEAPRFQEGDPPRLIGRSRETASSGEADDQTLLVPEGVLGDSEGDTAPAGSDEEDSSRLAELGEALHQAGILLNPRTRSLFASDFLTAAHVEGCEFRLKQSKGRRYQPGLLVVVLEGIRPGDPPSPVGFDGRDASRYAEWND